MKVENEKEKEESSNCLIVKHDDKTFLNLGCCHINIGLMFTYLYIISASGLNIINRIIFNLMIICNCISNYISFCIKYWRIIIIIK